MNILTFGPNGSGKGTQGAIVQKKYDIAHIESGAIFRDHIKGGTELGKKAKEFIDSGDLNTRADDQDEEAINKRHNIYYDDNTGTMAAVNYFKNVKGPKTISVDGSSSIGEVSESIMSELA